jgi:hypothetical protein
MKTEKTKASKVGRIVPINLLSAAKGYSSKMVADSCDECCGPYAQPKTSN